MAQHKPLYLYTASPAHTHTDTHNYNIVFHSTAIPSVLLFLDLCVGTEALMCLPVCTLAAGIAVGHTLAARTELNSLINLKSTVSAAAELVTSSLAKPSIVHVAGGVVQVII